MTENGLRQAYKNKPEALEEMLKIKPIEELCTLFDDENFVEKGAGKTERFYEAITNKEISSDNKNEEKTKSKKTYVALYPIRCNGELIEPNEEVTEEELDLQRLINIGAVGELLENRDK
ncbi:MAG: hypothetical protein ACRCWI_02190 [Brevinema sp.]